MALREGLRLKLSTSQIICFSIKFSNLTINVAELMALREGLRLAWERRLRRVVAELDSEVVYKLLISEGTEDHSLHNILEDCRSFKRLLWEFKIQHTKRDGNTCADLLAKMGHGCEGFQFWEDPPPLLAREVDRDIEAS
ncbi:hypothetical protein OROHE_022668 [Orobanche hederae]